MKPTILERAEPLKIGIPTNGQMKKDCAPVNDLLGLNKNSDGTFTTNKIPDAKFFPVRVETIAAYLRDQIFQFGIIGDDTAANTNLDIPLANRRRPVECGVILYPDSARQTTIYPERKVASLRKLPEVTLSLLRREEDIEEPFPQNGSIITSYTEAARKLLSTGVPKLNDPWNQIRAEKGQIEFLLRSMPKRFQGAVDVVRSGNTAREYRLAVVQKLLASQPSLWRSLQINSQMNDVQARLVEVLEPII